jgi:hypothetical protein
VARIAVGLVALAAPLFAASAAQGAIGTSKTLLTTNRPDLTSVTVAGPATVNFCFDTNIDPNGGSFPAVANSFDLGGYDEDTQTPNAAHITANRLNATCAQVTYTNNNGGAIDLTKYSIGTVQANAVLGFESGGPVGNLDDSAPLIGSDAHNGTRGLTAGPDLQTVIRDTTNNRITYVFDQLADACGPGVAPPCAGAQFGFFDQAGTGFNGATVLNETGNTVTVQFAPGVSPVSDATIAGSLGGVVQSRTPDPTHPNPQAVVAVPNTSGNTDRPDVSSASLVNGGVSSNQVDFVYDSQVANPVASRFHVASSDVGTLDGDAAAVIGTGNTVRVTFTGAAPITELLVQAHADDAAVTDTTGSVPSTRGSAPIGGNAGAFSLGYTTGPDAQALAIDRSTGAVTMTMDQRVDPATIVPGNINLVNTQGTVSAAVPATVSVSSTTNPGPVTVTAQFTPGQVSGIAGVQLEPNALLTFGPVDGYTPNGNVFQVFGEG